MMLKSNMYEICGALRNLVPFVQFKKREKHPQLVNTPKMVLIVNDDKVHRKIIMELLYVK